MHVPLHLIVALGLVVTFIPSQIFWFRRLGELARRLIRNDRWREAIGGAAAILYIFLFAYNLAWSRHRLSPVRLTAATALLQAPFLVWVVSSIFGFLVALPFWLVSRFWPRKPFPAEASAETETGPSPFASPIAATEKGSSERAISLPSAPAQLRDFSPSRRNFLFKAGILAGALPFAADAYGAVFELKDMTVVRRKIRLERLPKAFDGFRIVQLSDLHIGPFMTAREIRHVADIANRLKPDLLALTGDFVTWDASTQGAVVQSLSGLRAPYGIYGCLGNHELWAHCQASITRLFAKQNVKILRQERALIRCGSDAINLLGVDYQTHMKFFHGLGYVPRYLEGIRPLIEPDTANILLSHNPNTFDRAAELGVDLSLAGHTHGGQVTLNFISPDLSPARLITPYVVGWFQKPGGQLYVNRGIGTIFVPIRFGAPPEITVFELTRA
jgi:predicted MPP superfamily phosphohydrolase